MIILTSHDLTIPCDAPHQILYFNSFSILLILDFKRPNAEVNPKKAIVSEGHRSLSCPISFSIIAFSKWERFTPKSLVEWDVDKIFVRYFISEPNRKKLGENISEVFPVLKGYDNFQSRRCLKTIDTYLPT